MAQLPIWHSRLAALLAALLAGCAVAPEPEAPPAPPPARPVPRAEPPPHYPTLAAARFSDLPSWEASDHHAALDAFVRSCRRLGGRSEWSEICSRAVALSRPSSPASPSPPAPPPEGEGRFLHSGQLHRSEFPASPPEGGRFLRPSDVGEEEGELHPSPPPGGGGAGDGGKHSPLPRGEGPGVGATARRFFETHFKPHQVLTPDGGADGLITGYYEPLLRGSRTRGGRYRHPVYGVPGDLLTVDLTELQPELRGRRVRGRLEGRRVVPYFTRADIEAGRAPVAGREILWVDDALDLFFLQVQGSGRVVLPDGETVRLGYADHNGHPYTSIGRVLVERGELAPEQASMQGIRQWAGGNPARLSALLNENASYVFFRELPADPAGLGPPGALGAPLTPGYSIAVDPRFVPLGAPVYLATTQPSSPQPLNRLVLAQDTGTAITGAVRADLFWGFGPEAGQQAGRMKQRGRLWVLLPAGWPQTAAGALSSVSSEPSLPTSTLWGTRPPEGERSFAFPPLFER